MKTALVIHGHFYQPPRENPWTEVVEPEPSAGPYHDWNERIHAECYRSNGWARIMGHNDEVRAIVNNYLYLNFNFGPTLLSWMETHHPQDYQRIIEADRQSQALYGGHGNAIAQGYNHAILPLCNERDMRTQIRWGIREFKHRFRREPESLWMPETACSDRVLGALIDEGMTYAILSPHQAEKVKAPGDTEWHNVSDGSVDPGRPYIYKHRDGSGRSITLFFYDGPISKALAFEKALDSSQNLLDVFKRAQGGEGRVVNPATDGESYGHHKAWGERSLAHALYVAAAENGFEITNYGQFLEKHPAVWEAEIKAGPDGEGTAWSCSHGVGRWVRNCGCHTGGGENWNQEWRTPLRAALDLLRETTIDVFEKGSEGLLKDPWAARDDFIELILEPSLENRDRFFNVHSAAVLDAASRVRALTLLDMQRQAMLMYTSCGWFFNDISGIETIQILRYACRVIDMIEELGYPAPRRAFLKKLKEAKSNIAEFGNGERIFKTEVEPARVTAERLAAHMAISSLVEQNETEGVLGGTRFKLDDTALERHGRLSFSLGRVSLESMLTGRVQRFSYAAFHFGGIDFFCAARHDPGDDAFAKSREKITAAVRAGLLPGMIRAAREEFGPREYGIDDLLPDGRHRLSTIAFGDLVRSLSEQYGHIYEDNHGLLDMFESKGISLPVELRTAAEYTLGRRFEIEIRKLSGEINPTAYQPAIDIAEQVKIRGYRIDRTESNRIFSSSITEAVRQAVSDPDDESMQNAIDLLKLCKRLDLRPELDRAQELAVLAGQMPHSPKLLVELAALLGLEPGLLHQSSSVDARESEKEITELTPVKTAENRYGD